LATFGAVTGAGFLLSGGLCILAARDKLANLGAFLPYSVLCGLITTISILMWTSGFSVDVGKRSVKQVLTSGDWNLMGYALLHDTPSLIVGIVVHILGPQNPLHI
jgi:MFS superfamily sulfate permease-like transporter